MYMKRIVILFLLVLFSTSLFAENFSEMSTQELIAIMGYVKSENKKKFENELKSRITTMSPKEKQEYQKNLKKLKK